MNSPNRCGDSACRVADSPPATAFGTLDDVTSGGCVHHGAGLGAELLRACARQIVGSMPCRQWIAVFRSDRRVSLGSRGDRTVQPAGHVLSLAHPPFLRFPRARFAGARTVRKGEAGPRRQRSAAVQLPAFSATQAELDLEDSMQARTKSIPASPSEMVGSSVSVACPPDLIGAATSR